MSRLAKILPVAAALAGALALPAAAQVAGTYTGTSADGNPLSFTVATDPNTGLLTVTEGGLGFSALCNDGSTFSTGWGYFVNAPDIVNRKISYVQTYPYFVFTVSLKFSMDGQSATGTVMAVSPELSPIGPKPKKALFCTSVSQPLGVTLQPPGAKPPAMAQSQSRAAGR